MKVTVIDKKTGKGKSVPRKHAAVLLRFGRGRYMTRDMVPEPQPLPEPLVELTPNPERYSVTPGAAVDHEFKLGEEETDDTGAKWDADLHVSTKAKNADGTWRKKPTRSAV